MTVSRDPYLQGGPLPVETPRDPNADTVLPQSERGEDDMRGDVIDTLLDTPARPLTHDEKEATEDDPGRAPRTFAPASERVPVARPPATNSSSRRGCTRRSRPKRRSRLATEATRPRWAKR